RFHELDWNGEGRRVRVPPVDDRPVTGDAHRWARPFLGLASAAAAETDGMTVAGGAASAVVFDIDGTLIDSVDFHARAWQETLAHFGISVSFDDVRSPIGRGGEQ